jgi:hypothetical protein
MTGIDAIIGLIQAEARRRTDPRDYVSRLHDVNLEIDHRVGMILKAIREKETEDANKKGG